MLNNTDICTSILKFLTRMNYQIQMHFFKECALCQSFVVRHNDKNAEKEKHDK